MKKEIYTQQIQAFQVKVQGENFTFLTDYPEYAVNNHSIGLSPTGLLASALASCLTMTAQSYIQKHQLDVRNLSLKLEVNFLQDELGYYLESVALIDITSQDQKLDLQECVKYVERYCRVSNILQSSRNKLDIKVNLHQ